MWWKWQCWGDQSHTTQTKWIESNKQWIIECRKESKTETMFYCQQSIVPATDASVSFGWNFAEYTHSKSVRACITLPEQAPPAIFYTHDIYIPQALLTHSQKCRPYFDLLSPSLSFYLFFCIAMLYFIMVQYKQHISIDSLTHITASESAAAILRALIHIKLLMYCVCACSREKTHILTRIYRGDAVSSHSCLFTCLFYGALRE